METIPKADCQKIGIIKKTHGVHGQVIIEFENHYEESVENAERFFIELDGLLVPFFVRKDGIRFKSAKSVIVGFDWVETENYAKRLVGNNVFLFYSEIVLTDKETFTDDFKGYILIDKKNGEIGKILKTDNFAGNLVFSVQYQNSEVLVPFSKPLTLKIDKKKKIITMSLPEGLL